MTNKQVNAYKEKATTIYLDVEKAVANANYADILFEQVLPHIDEPLAPMVYATVPPDELKRIQAQFGAEQASQAIERTFAKLAQRLKEKANVENFITAGGETSSIVVQKLGFSGFQIGKQIAPGVPWLKALGESTALALKSGNFGKETFFIDAQGMML
ncbi:4-hydroxy-3-methylbut-2-enyl diphosphate reductase [Rodentibacter pneumotropicus]|uniref:4-hydroxy-3-methylbut-2-enyl diphosphate reductase n=2 Tax=Pasteurellaceae TaxID=712 RepID=A0A3S4TTJ9_9PAST|nr:4-hydroxy-3-methylbut-2-enyl diphosphate reductase [Rodentibacter pneumotropicus]